jgi:hypothetical protein
VRIVFCVRVRWLDTEASADPAGDPNVRPPEQESDVEGEDDGMQHIRALFQFRVLPAETCKFLSGIGTSTQAELQARSWWRHARFDLPPELVTQVDRTVSGRLADASDRCDVLPGELGVCWRNGPVEKVAHGHFELASIVQRHSHG